MEVVREITITDEMVRSFSELTGDKNPIHLDDDYAKHSRFGRRIAHGMLVSSFISTIIATDYPGEGSIYVNQELNFILPCYIGDKLVYRINEIEEENGKYTLSTLVFRDDICILSGKAFVIKR